ncbi:hypothetical protein [Mycobacterium sp.]|uniref:hypothetical protein n=1 Tax=Mycobacterium sp. TaxID=1785 RepID=UPI002D4729F4|nr:hypothetical protein [Mycobacterium sp.]HZA08434.1 hypothetical protein [Mycobacterium sp.]
MSTAAHNVDLEISAKARSTNRKVDGARVPWTRPSHSGDVAQAQVFIDLLKAEILDLEQGVDALEQRGHRRDTKRAADREPPGLVCQRERLAEARRLLQALRIRFLLD